MIYLPEHLLLHDIGLNFVYIDSVICRETSVLLCGVVYVAHSVVYVGHSIVSTWMIANLCYSIHVLKFFSSVFFEITYSVALSFLKTFSC